MFLSVLQPHLVNTWEELKEIYEYGLCLFPAPQFSIHGKVPCCVWCLSAPCLSYRLSAPYACTLAGKLGGNKWCILCEQQFCTSHYNSTTLRPFSCPPVRRLGEIATLLYLREIAMPHKSTPR